VIDQQKLKNEFVISGQGTVAEWNTELAQVDALMAAFKRRISLIRWSALAAFLVFAIPAALGIAGGVPFVVLAIVVPIGILIYSAVAASKKVIADRVSFLRLVRVCFMRTPAIADASRFFCTCGISAKKFPKDRTRTATAAPRFC
jgi:hypothetical protein